MSKFLLGFCAAILLIVLLGFGYFALGMAPVATTSAPLPFESTLAMMAVHRAAGRGMPTTVPIQASEDNLIAGAKTYRVHCAVCHGLPGQPATAIAKGEFPKPPELFGKEGVTDDPAGETYWKVAHGIRLTGMPGFQSSLTDEQMWQVSLLVAGADKISDPVRGILSAPLAQ